MHAMGQNPKPPERSHVSFRQLLRTYQRTRVQQLCAISGHPVGLPVPQCRRRPQTAPLTRDTPFGVGRVAAPQPRDRLASLTRLPRRRGKQRLGGFGPSAPTVVTLMTRSNFVGCSMGMFPGFVPRGILSTASAERRTRSGRFGPSISTSCFDGSRIHASFEVVRPALRC